MDDLNKFISLFDGDRRQAAEAVGASYALVCSWLNGARPITRNFATKIVEVAKDRGVTLSRERLIFADEQAA